MPLIAIAMLAGVASVIDGDTLEVHGQKIRLWGIDAPEARQTCSRTSGEVWRCGQQAALALAEHIGSTTVQCDEKARDRYERVVATCVVGGKDLGAWLVSEGWALDWPKYSAGAYSSAQEDAAEHKRNLWSGSFVEPWNWRAKKHH